MPCDAGRPRRGLHAGLLSMRSIRTKLVLITMLGSSVAITATGAAVALHELREVRGAMLEDLALLARVIGDGALEAVLARDAEAAKRELRTLSAKPEISEACLYLHDGSLLAAYRRTGKDTELPFPNLTTFGHLFAGDGLESFAPITAPDDERVLGWTYLRSDLEVFEERAASGFGFLAAIGVAALGGVYLLVSRLVRVVSEPIRDLAATAQSVTRGRDYSVRATRTTRDETGLLIDAFNDMLEEIERRDAELHGHRENLEATVHARTA